MSEGNSIAAEQLSEGPSNGGITGSATAIRAEQPGKGPGNGGIARSATGKKGVKRKYDSQTFEIKYQAITESRKGAEIQVCDRQRFQYPGQHSIHVA